MEWHPQYSIQFSIPERPSECAVKIDWRKMDGPVSSLVNTAPKRQ